MMKQYKIVDNGFILGINSSFGIRITSEEYKRIKKALENVPPIGDNQVAKLRDSDLQWVISDNIK